MVDRSSGERGRSCRPCDPQRYGDLQRDLGAPKNMLATRGDNIEAGNHRLVTGRAEFPLKSTQVGM